MLSFTSSLSPDTEAFAIFVNDKLHFKDKKNILSKDEYNKKISLFRKKFDSYKKNRQEKIESVSKKKVEATKKLLSELNPLLADYSKNNGISIILRKKDIVIAKTSLDISDEIIELLNSKIKKIKLN